MMMQAPAGGFVQFPGAHPGSMMGMRPEMKAPDALDREKNVYHKALESQLRKQTEAVKAEAQVQKAMLQQQAINQIAQLTLQVEEQLKLQCLQIDQRSNFQTAALMEAAVTQRTAVDERSAIATMEFQRRQAQDEMTKRSQAIQKQFYDAEVKMMRELQGASAQGSPKK